MKGVVLRRELAATASPAFVAAVVIHVVVLTLFIFGWAEGRGAAPLAPRSIYEQLRLVQLVLLTVVLTWTACRTMAEERGRDLALLSGLTAAAPSWILAARSVAVATCLILVVLAGLPLMLLVFRMTSTPFVTFAHDEILMTAVALAAGASSMAGRAMTASRVGGWVAALVLTTVAVLTAVRVPYGSAVLAAAAGAVAGVVAWYGGRSCLYLDELAA